MNGWDPQDKPANDNNCGAFAFYLGLSVGAFTVAMTWLAVALLGG